MKRRGRIRQNVASDDPPQEPVGLSLYENVFEFPIQMDVDAGNRPLADRLEALLDNDKAADVVFVVGDPQKVCPFRMATAHASLTLFWLNF